MDGDEGLVNHLLHCMWQQGNNGDGVAFLEVAEEFFNRVARISSSIPAALVHLLFGRVSGAIIRA